MMLEVGVACLQAYVFSILVLIYIKEIYVSIIKLKNYNIFNKYKFIKYNLNEKKYLLDKYQIFFFLKNYYFYNKIMFLKKKKEMILSSYMGCYYLKNIMKKYSFLQKFNLLRYFFSLYKIYHKFHQFFKLDEKSYI